jgi:DNA-binding NtrC family response regulator
MKGYLESVRLFDYKIILLNDGIDALNIIHFDTLFFMNVQMVISDLNMKFLNGDLLFKMLNQINNNAFHSIIFVMYTNTEMHAISNIGIKHFLKKPCSKSDVIRLMGELNLQKEKFIFNVD